MKLDAPFNRHSIDKPDLDSLYWKKIRYILNHQTWEWKWKL